MFRVIDGEVGVDVPRMIVLLDDIINNNFYYWRICKYIVWWATYANCSVLT